HRAPPRAARPPQATARRGVPAAAAGAPAAAAAPARRSDPRCAFRPSSFRSRQPRPEAFDGAMEADLERGPAPASQRRALLERAVAIGKHLDSLALAPGQRRHRLPEPRRLAALLG